MLINQAQTAIDAYHHGAQRVMPREKSMILECLRGQSLTIGEIAKRTGLEKSSVSGRRRELLDSGDLVHGLRRRCTISGVMCESVKIPDGG